MKKLIVLLIIVVLIKPLYAQISLDATLGVAFQGYNKVRIPNKTGTTFDFNDDFNIKGAAFNYSLRLGYCFKEKNHLFILYAPFAVNYTGVAPFDIKFQNSTFIAGQKINGYYKFNSYRLTYRRDLLSSEKWTLGVGFTAKIRDAEIELSTNGLSDKKDDFGFVPLLNLYAAYSFNNLTAYFEGDGLAGGPGRAFDFSSGGIIKVNNNLEVKAAYRLLEGGANVSAVYNFTLLHFACLGFIISF